MSGFAPPKTDQPVADATRACILRIGLDRLARAAEWDGYMRAVLDDYRRLKAEDIGSRIVPPSDRQTHHNEDCMIIHNSIYAKDLPQMEADLATLNRNLADITEILVLRIENLQRHVQELGSGMDDAWDSAPIEAAKTAIAKYRMYYTPDEIIVVVAGSGSYLDIVGNPPYEDRKPE